MFSADEVRAIAHKVADAVLNRNDEDHHSVADTVLADHGVVPATAEATAGEEQAADAADGGGDTAAEATEGDGAEKAGVPAESAPADPQVPSPSEQEAAAEEAAPQAGTDASFTGDQMAARQEQVKDQMDQAAAERSGETATQEGTTHGS